MVLPGVPQLRAAHRMWQHLRPESERVATCVHHSTRQASDAFEWGGVKVAIGNQSRTNSEGDPGAIAHTNAESHFRVPPSWPLRAAQTMEPLPLDRISRQACAVRNRSPASSCINTVMMLWSCHGRRCSRSASTTGAATSLCIAVSNSPQAAASAEQRPITACR